MDGKDPYSTPSGGWMFIVYGNEGPGGMPPHKETEQKTAQGRTGGRRGRGGWS
jgi:hypothetical protein